MRKTLHQLITSRLLLAALAILLGLIGQPLCANAQPVSIQNRTYTPLHYRIKTSQGFAGWKVLLPEESALHRDSPDMGIEVRFDENRTAYYDLVGGATYGLIRYGPRDAPEFLKCHSKMQKAPRPPGAPAPYASVSEDQFAPLERFIADCNRDNQPYRLSMKKLAVDCARAQKNGPLPPELRFVRGFTWFFGYMIDDENDDVILLGIKDPARPPLDVDCLATAIQCASSGKAPYCSLEATDHPAVLKSVVAGVPWKTRYAEVMIRADNEITNLEVGYWKPSIPGFKNQRDHFAEVLSTQGRKAEDYGTENEKVPGRYWYNFNSDIPRAVADADGKLLYLYRNPVRLSSEKKVNGAFGTGQTRPSWGRFVADFTKHLDALGKHYPSIAELQALFRLYDLMRHIAQVGKTAPPEISYWLNGYEHPYKGPPLAVPRLRYADSRVIKERMDVPSFQAGASYSGTETLAGYGRLAFDLHANGRATMHDAKGTVQGSWQASGNQITLRFYGGTVVYVGTRTERFLVGGASNGKTTWSWSMDSGFETSIWTWGKR